MEQWTQILGASRYEVSTLGRVRSSGRILKPFPVGKGYLAVGLWQGNRRSVRKVAHLVLESFVGPRPRGLEAAHGDGVKTNNAINNLRWATPESNRSDKGIHGTGRGYRQINRRERKVTPTQIELIRQRAKEGIVYRVIGAEFGISKQLVSDIVNEKGQG